MSDPSMTPPDRAPEPLTQAGRLLRAELASAESLRQREQEDRFGNADATPVLLGAHDEAVVARIRAIEDEAATLDAARDSRPVGEGLDVERLDLRDELLEAEHEVAAFMHSRLWGPTLPVHDTEPGDGSDCHECYAETGRIFDIIARAALSTNQPASTEAGEDG